MTVCIIGIGTLNSSMMSSEDTQQLHRLLKQRDLSDNKVHSVVNFDTIKQRYQETKNQKELKRQKNELKAEEEKQAQQKKEQKQKAELRQQQIEKQKLAEKHAKDIKQNSD